MMTKQEKELKKQIEVFAFEEPAELRCARLLYAMGLDSFDALKKIKSHCPLVTDVFTNRVVNFMRDIKNGVIKE